MYPHLLSFFHALLNYLTTSCPCPVYILFFLYSYSTKNISLAFFSKPFCFCLFFYDLFYGFLSLCLIPFGFCLFFCNLLYGFLSLHLIPFIFLVCFSAICRVDFFLFTLCLAYCLVWWCCQEIFQK